MDARNEHLRELTDQKTGKASYKSVIFNKKKTFFEDYNKRLKLPPDTKLIRKPQDCMLWSPNYNEVQSK